jgi:hypothetical protein
MFAVSGIAACSDNAPGNPARESISVPRNQPPGEGAPPANAKPGTTEKAEKAVGGSAGRKISL